MAADDLSAPNLSRRDFAALSGATTVVALAGEAQAAEVVETDVTIKTVDGTCDAALYHPAGKGKWPVVLIWPDALGLRPAFRDMGKRMAAQGYVVLVPNPFYRSRPARSLPVPSTSEILRIAPSWPCFGRS